MLNKIGTFLVLAILTASIAYADSTVLFSAGAGATAAANGGAIVPSGTKTLKAAIPSPHAFSVMSSAVNVTITAQPGKSIKQVLIDNVVLTVGNQAALGVVGFVNLNSPLTFRYSKLTGSHSVKPSFYTYVNPATDLYKVTAVTVLGTGKGIVNLQRTSAPVSGIAKIISGQYAANPTIVVTATGIGTSTVANIKVNTFGAYSTISFTGNSSSRSITLSGRTSKTGVGADTKVTATFNAGAGSGKAYFNLQGGAQLLVGTAQSFIASATSTVPFTGSSTWTMALVSAPVGATAAPAAQTGAGPKTFSYTPNKAGAYTVRMTVAGDQPSAVSTDVTFTVVSAIQAITQQCASCHATRTPQVFSQFSSANGQMNCTSCHGTVATAHSTLYVPNTVCTPCHVADHKFQAMEPAFTTAKTCVGCHAFARAVRHPNTTTSATAATQGPALVSDNNNGVRAIGTEFAKWSHHVTGVTLNDAHCAACHLEGKVLAGAIVIDNTYHMVDAKVHLRNADTDADMQWDPAAPNHTVMDNFCMSCHDANGAVSTLSQGIQTHITNVVNNGGNNIIAGALNPFGDTISNGYDKMLRGRVVNVFSQFSTTNASHHAVRGKKYSGRTEAAGARQIANVAGFNANKSETVYAFNNNSSATYASNYANPAIKGNVAFRTFTTAWRNNTAWAVPEDGKILENERKTIYEAGRFVSTYTTLANAGGEAAGHNGGETLGDDSTLHCGDCHTVGQWKENAAKNADGTFAPAAIGAHGSNNEYMLRNSIGTDQLHRGAQYNYAPANMAKNGTAFAGRQWSDEEFPVAPTTVDADNVAVPATEVPTLQPFLVCYNCHVYDAYGSVYFSNTAMGGREGGHAYGDHTRGNYCNGPYNTAGSGRATTYTAVYGHYSTNSGFAGAQNTFQGIANFNFGRLQPGSTTGAAAGMNGSAAGGGNIFQIQCASCHNAGLNNGFGGIHGSKIDSYTDGNGLTQKPRRFLPGLGNVGWVPGDKNLTPALTEDQKWEQAANVSKGQAGCYTLSTSTDAYTKNMTNTGAAAEVGTTNNSSQVFGTWGACTDHGSGAGAKVDRTGDALERTLIRPVTY